MRILLTGAGPRGFIGRSIKPQLQQRYELFTPSSKELDLCDYDALARYLDKNQIEAVIHGAAQSVIYTGPEDALKHDLQMFYNLDKLSDCVEKVLFFGSGAAFDKRLPINNVREEEIGRAVPEWYYALEKYIMTLHARNSRNLYDLRLFGIFGPYEQWQRKFISNLCCKAIYDLPLTIRQNCLFDFLYIEDLPPIVIWFLEHTPLYHDYNVCTGQPIDLVSIAKIVRDVSGKDLPIVVAKEGWNLPYTADNSRLRMEMGSLQLHSMRQAVEELYDYYQAHRSEIPYEEVKETR
jgi:GDP-L-fucose synthase